MPPGASASTKLPVHSPVSVGRPPTECAHGAPTNASKAQMAPIAAAAISAAPKHPTRARPVRRVIESTVALTAVLQAIDDARFDRLIFGVGDEDHPPASPWPAGDARYWIWLRRPLRPPSRAPGSRTAVRQTWRATRPGLLYAPLLAPRLGLGLAGAVDVLSLFLSKTGGDERALLLVGRRKILPSQHFRHEVGTEHADMYVDLLNVLPPDISSRVNRRNSPRATVADEAPGGCGNQGTAARGAGPRRWTATACGASPRPRESFPRWSIAAAIRGLSSGTLAGCALSATTLA